MNRKRAVVLAVVALAVVAGAVVLGRRPVPQAVQAERPKEEAQKKLAAAPAPAPEAPPAPSPDAPPAAESKPMALKAAPKTPTASSKDAARLSAAIFGSSPGASGGVGALSGKGMGGLSLRGTGSGGGGVGQTIGIGSIGTKGRGSGAGGAYGSAGLGSYGSGSAASHGSAASYGEYASGSGSLHGSAPSRRTVISYGSAAASGSGSGVGVLGGAMSLRRAVGDSAEGSSEGYRNYGVNGFTSTAEDKLSTFAIDVDTASYTISRRKLLEGTLPPKDSVRVEEFLNYFHYDYPAPKSAALAVHLDAAPSPFNPGRHLLRVGVQGKKLSIAERKPAHLTFLVDVSGSMQSADKLPLAKRALRMLVDNLKDSDTVAMVTYAGGVKLALPPVGIDQKARIHAAIEELDAGGSTAMAGGLELAYKQALRTLDERSVSRVIVLSDGDANVGASSHQEILKLIRGYVKEGVTLSTVGFGMGNYKDEMMEQLADRGNGNYFYVDSLMQARRIFQEQLGGTLEVIAQDVKLQVELDPAQVKRYRLVGYENRDIADKDFRNDKVDAGEIGAGHTVTALYEVELAEGAGEGLATVRIRAKRPRGATADEAAYAFPAAALAPSFAEASPDLRFATAVMGAAEIFRQSPHAAGWSYARVLEIARGAAPAGNAERAEFIALLERARSLVSKVASR